MITSTSSRNPRDALERIHQGPASRHIVKIGLLALGILVLYTLTQVDHPQATRLAPMTSEPPLTNEPAVDSLEIRVCTCDRMSERLAALTEAVQRALGPAINCMNKGRSAIVQTGCFPVLLECMKQAYRSLTPLCLDQAIAGGAREGKSIAFFSEAAREVTGEACKVLADNQNATAQSEGMRKALSKLLSSFPCYIAKLKNFVLR